ncbi:MAG: GIY-YIG nuclease family protein [Muribaculaceae bacterium]|nr:GIY-YIG nuclease family protein [Muribaculaceae bacterium]
MNDKHFVYILLTENNTLYCGYTDDVEKRFQIHLEGKGAKYTRANKPVKIVYQKEFKTKSEAMKEEYRIKHNLTREEKLNLIKDSSI